MRHFPILALLALTPGLSTLRAQTCTIQSASILLRPLATGNAPRAELRLTFAARPGAGASARITYQPGVAVETCTPELAFVGSEASCPLTMAPAEVQGFRVEVTIPTASGTSTSCELLGDVVQRAGDAAALALATTRFKEAVQAAKPASEKNLFAALSGASGGGSSAGDGVLSTTFSPTAGVITNFLLNRSSLLAADAKQLQVGVGLRRVIPLYLSGKAAIDSAVSLEDKYQRALDARMLFFVLDGFARYEGDATKFEVTNGIADIPLQLSSRVMSIGPVGRDGFWKFRLMPVGVEAGKNLGSTNPNLKEYTILRSKHGGSFSLRFAPASFAPAKLELEVQAAARYLHRGETSWNQEAMAPIDVTSGWKPYADVGLKLFLAQSDKLLLGFRVNYTRGGLPPVFNDTKAFRYGLLIESRDGDGPTR